MTKTEMDTQITETRVSADCPPIDDHGPRLLETERRRWRAGEVAIVGVPYDCTASYRPGARFGPDAIRAASISIETWSMHQQLDMADVARADAGNVEVPFGSPTPMVEVVGRLTRAVLADGATPLLLGGEHSITTGAVEAVAERFPGLVLVQLDAHADLRESFLGEEHSHACTMRRCLSFVDALVQVGIRSATREEHREMVDNGRLVAADPVALRRALAPYAGRPIYLTIDLDFFDPSCLPGTGTPEPGGADWREFEALTSVLAECTLVAADVVELAPNLDASGISSVLAAKVVREVLILLGRGLGGATDGR